MLIKKLRIGSFGKFQNREFDFAKGLNVIYGENEAGKSTIHAFIKAMLFGIEIKRGSAGKDDLYAKYLPWETPGAYAGSMDFEHDGVNYRITRVFLKNSKSCTCTDLDTGKEVYLVDEKITGLIPELNESNYYNTIALGQQSAKTDKALAINLGNYISNLELAKTGEVDIHGALEKLKKKAKEVSAKKCEIDETELNRWREELADKISEVEADMQTAQGSLDEARAKVTRLEAELKELEDKFQQESISFAEQAKTGENTDFAADIDQVVLETKQKQESLSQQNESKVLELENTAKLQITELDKERQKKLFVGKSEYDNCKRLVKESRSQIDEKRSTLDTAINKLRWESEENRKGIAEVKAERDGLVPKETELQNKKGSYKNSAVMGGIVAVTGGIIAYIFSEKSSIGVGTGLLLMLVGIVVALMSVIKSRENEQELDNTKKRQEDLSIKERELQALVIEAERQSNSLEEEMKKYGMELDELKDKENAAERTFENATKDAENSFTQEKSFVEYELQKHLNDEKLELERGISELNYYREQKIAEIRGAEQAAKELAERQKLIQAGREETLRIEMGSKKNELEGSRKMVVFHAENLTSLNEKADDLYEKSDTIKGKLALAKELNSWAEKELVAIDMARETISRMSELIYENFGKQLNEKLSSLAGKLTNGKYNQILVDNELSIRFMGDLDFQSANGLSAGTLEQLYLALRLSIGELFFGNTQVPVILDEPFAYYDEKRMEAGLKELGGSDKQILLFTCKESEQKLLDRMAAEYRCVML